MSWFQEESEQGEKPEGPQPTGEPPELGSCFLSQHQRRTGSWQGGRFGPPLYVSPVPQEEGVQEEPQAGQINPCSLFLGSILILWGFPGGSGVKNPSAMQQMQEMQVQSLGWEDSLKKGTLPLVPPGKPTERREHYKKISCSFHPEGGNQELNHFFLNSRRVIYLSSVPSALLRPLLCHHKVALLHLCL